MDRLDDSLDIGNEGMGKSRQDFWLGQPRVDACGTHGEHLMPSTAACALANRHTTTGPVVKFTSLSILPKAAQHLNIQKTL